MSDASHVTRAASPQSDYVRYGANVSRPPSRPDSPSDFPPETPGGDGRGVVPGAVTGPGSTRPPAAIVVALIVAAEAVTLLLAAGWYGLQLLSGAPVLSFWGAIFTLGLLLAFSAWLFAVGHFLFHGYRWTRAAALVAQLFVLTIGVPTITAGLIVAGLAMLLPAALAIVLLFTPRVVAFASRVGNTQPTL